MTRIFVGHNFFGAGNFGDDLTLQGFLADVAAARLKIEITICTPHDLQSQRGRFPEVNWLPDDESVREGALREADVWLGLGDTPFQLDSGPWFLDHNSRELDRCKRFGKPMYFLGVGCESEEAGSDQRSKAILAGARHIWTRDEQSTRTLRSHVAATPVTTGADLANLVFPDSYDPPALAEGTLGMLLAFEREEQLSIPELEAFLLAEPRGRVRWLVQEFRSLPFVEQSIVRRLTESAYTCLEIMPVDYRRMSMGDFLHSFGAPETVVTSRYHGALVGAWHGCKVLVVTRSSKLAGIAEQLALPSVERIASRSALKTALGSAHTVQRQRLTALRDRAHTMCRDFFNELERRPAPNA